MQVEQPLGQILQAITNLNPTGIHVSQFGLGVSMGDIMARDVNARRRAAATQPIKDAILEEHSKAMWVNSHRLFGYSEDAIRKKDKEQATGTQFEQKIARYVTARQLGNGLDLFAGAIYNRKDVWGYRGQDYLDSYQQAAKEIAGYRTGGGLRSYKLGDAYAMAGKMVSEGRYDLINPERRGQKIIQDLEKMSAGVSELTDALQGSLSELMDSFEHLTGTSGTLMSPQRFNNMAKRLSESIKFRGATMQSIAQQAQANMNFMDGTGVSQAYSAGAGILSASILAQGINREGATARGMQDTFNRGVRNNLLSGRQREYVGAFTLWASEKGYNMTKQTEQLFRRQVGTDPGKIQEYIKEREAQDFINGDLVTKNMNVWGHDISLVDSEERLRQMVKQNEYFNPENDNRLAYERDLLLSDNDFREALKQRKLAREFGGKSWDMLSKVERAGMTKEIEKIVQSRRYMFSVAYNSRNADDAMNIFANSYAATNSTQEINTYDALKRINKNISTKGLAGVFEQMVTGGTSTLNDFFRGMTGLALTDKEQIALGELDILQDHYKSLQTAETRDDQGNYHATYRTNIEGIGTVDVTTVNDTVTKVTGSDGKEFEVNKDGTVKDAQGKTHVLKTLEQEKKDTQERIQKAADKTAAEFNKRFVSTKETKDKDGNKVITTTLADGTSVAETFDKEGKSLRKVYRAKAAQGEKVGRLLSYDERAKVDEHIATARETEQKLDFEQKYLESTGKASDPNIKGYREVINDALSKSLSVTTGTEYTTIAGIAGTSHVIEHKTHTINSGEWKGYKYSEKTGIVYDNEGKAVSSDKSKQIISAIKSPGNHKELKLVQTLMDKQVRGETLSKEELAELGRATETLTKKGVISADHAGNWMAQAAGFKLDDKFGRQMSTILGTAQKIDASGVWDDKADKLLSRAKSVAEYYYSTDSARSAESRTKAVNELTQLHVEGGMSKEEAAKKAEAQITEMEANRPYEVQVIRVLNDIRNNTRKD